MRIETGDDWELRCGDCLDPETGLASLESVDHVITDPPYDEHTHRGARTHAGAADGVPFDPIRADVLAHALVEFAPRWLIVFCPVESLGIWRQISGDNWIRGGLWDRVRPSPQLTGDRPGQAAEGVAIMHPPGRKRWNGGGSPAIWRFDVERGAARPNHPTPKPLALMEALVSDFTDPGELICDPFTGSGTTGVACIRMGRRFVGWEKDPEFFETAVKRLRKTRRQYTLFEASDPGKQEGLF